jgi:uncharacterized protein
MSKVFTARGRLPIRLMWLATAILLWGDLAAAQRANGPPAARERPNAAAPVNGPPAARPPFPAPAPVHHVLVSRDLRIATPRGQIVATLTVPEGSPRPPVILILHGYTGNRNETPVGATRERMFQRTARIFGEMGLASLRFDFINSGESTGQWRDTTFSGQEQDVAAMLGFVSREASIDPQRIGLLGYSQGGLVALKTVAKERGVGAVALWNPVLDPERTYDHLLTPQTVQRGYDMYRLHEMARPVAGSALLPGFMYEVKTTYPLVDGVKFSGPILIVGGRRDTVAGPVDALGAMLTRLRGTRSTNVVMVDGDHGFDHTATPAILDEAISASGRFFTRVFQAK